MEVAMKLVIKLFRRPDNDKALLLEVDELLVDTLIRYAEWSERNDMPVDDKILALFDKGLGQVRNHPISFWQGRQMCLEYRSLRVDLEVTRTEIIVTIADSDNPS